MNLQKQCNQPKSNIIPFPIQNKYLEEIRELILQQRFTFPEQINPELCAFFQCSARIAELAFGVKEEIILLAYCDERGRNGDYLLMDYGFPFIAELVVKNGKGQFIELKSTRSVHPEAEIYGKIIGYALGSETEADVIAKYVERIMLYGKKQEGITIEKLIELGYAK